MASRLRVAVIGAGRWAASAHLPGFFRSPLAELVAICDLDLALARRRAGEFSIPTVTTDYRELLGRADVDVVDIVTRGDHQDLVFEVPLEQRWELAVRRLGLDPSGFMVGGGGASA